SRRTSASRAAGASAKNHRVVRVITAIHPLREASDRSGYSMWRAECCSELFVFARRAGEPLESTRAGRIAPARVQGEPRCGCLVLLPVSRPAGRTFGASFFLRGRLEPITLWLEEPRCCRLG